jgi:peptidoglycan/LPS O-acetylase OafA/YrhL
MPLTDSSPKRLTELDSLRGIAALTVVFSHFQILWLYESMANSSRMARRIFWYATSPFSDGHEAVILFFVLSGFVLSIPAIVEKAQTYPVFITRRIFRIYFPYLAALALAVLGCMKFHGPVTNSEWMRPFWSSAVDWHLVGQHILFLGSYDATQYDPPIWSLIYEMRISLIFPVLCALALKLKPAPSLLFGVALSVATAVLINLYGHDDTTAYLLLTLHYAGIFVVGIYLARQQKRIAEFYRSRSRTARIVAAFVAALLYIYAGGAWTNFMRPSADRGLALTGGDWFTVLGASAFMVFSLNSEHCRRFLNWRPVHMLGQMSYSLYLLHFIVLMLLLHLLYGKVPLLIIFALCLVFSIAASWVFYRAVEKPCMNLGRRLSQIMIHSQTK